VRDIRPLLQAALDRVCALLRKVRLI